MTISTASQSGSFSVTDMALQFSAARQEELFSLIQGQQGFLFYLALTFAMIGGVLLLIRPALWRWQYISCYFFLLLVVFIIPVQSSDLFFKNIPTEAGQAHRIFSPQGVILDVGNQVRGKISETFSGASGKYVNQLMTLENTDLNDLQYQTELNYYRTICEPVGGADTGRFVGTGVHTLAKTDEGRAFANKLAHSYFNIKHVYRLNEYYYEQAERNPLVGTAIDPAYGILLTGNQSASKIEPRIADRFASFITQDDLEKLGWDNKGTWQKEAAGISASIQSAQAATEEKITVHGTGLVKPKVITIPLPRFLLEPNGHDGAIDFYKKMDVYTTPYGLKKQMDYPLVIALGAGDDVFNCLDFHERMVEKLRGLLQQRVDGWYAMVADISEMLPPNTEEVAEVLVMDEVILPHLGQKLYGLNSSSQADFEDKLGRIFPHVQSLLMGVFLFITPLLLLLGLLLPFWGVGLLFLTVMAVGWLEVWQLFMTIGEGIYQHIAPFVVTDISLEGLTSVYIYGLAVVHGVVFILTVLLLPAFMKALPFNIQPSESKLFGEKKQKVVIPQLEGLLDKLKENLPERIKQQVMTEEHKNRIAMQQSRTSVANERMTEKVSEKIKHSERAGSYVASAAMKESQQQTATMNAQRTPEERGSTQYVVGRGAAGGGSSGDAGGVSSGNAYGMFQKIMQENYMTLGHGELDALNLTEKYMRNMSDDDLRAGESDGKKYVDVKQESLREKVSGGQKTADGYVRFYNKG